MAEKDGGKATIEPFEHCLYYSNGARRPGTVYLDGRGPEADKEEVLRFVDHKAFNSYYEYSAICGMLVAIRDEHLRAGFSNPLKDKPLVNIAVIDLSERRRETPLGGEHRWRPRKQRRDRSSAKRRGRWN